MKNAFLHYVMLEVDHHIILLKLSKALIIQFLILA